MKILSLGAGVQSSTMALMASRGEFPSMPDAAIFSDTGWEPKKVYEWLDWLEPQLSFPLYRVSAGNLRNDIIKKTNSTGQRFAAVPWFVLDRGKIGMGRRQCTSEYKLRPIQRKVVELTGGRKKASCEMWIGISTDEVIRMRPSRVQYIVNKYPLVEGGISRNDCLKWFENNMLPRPPKSSCIGCPFHSDNQWRDLRDHSPDEWKDAVELDRLIRDNSHRGIRVQQFMHRSCKPLDEVDLRTSFELGQSDLFGNECEGMCGV